MSCKKNIIKYCKIRFRLMSPLEIGSGNNAKTDHDIILTGSGTPFIPGSVIAGYFRDAIFRVLLQEKGKSEAKRAVYEKLGFVIIEKDAASAKDDQSEEESEKSRESSVIFYDANINEDTFHIDTRDMVALDENKVSRPGAKFDTEVLEPNVTFDTYLEECLYPKGDDSMIDRILRIWASEDVAFGSKTTRGMGLTQLEQVWVREFNLDKEDDVKEWVDFSVYGGTSGKTFTDQDDITSTYIIQNGNDSLVTSRDEWIIKLSLRQIGGMSIRRYTTAVSSKEKKEPDYKQLTEHVWEKVPKETSEGITYDWRHSEKPVIPGSSWAGAFRHHMKLLMNANESQMEKWFGFVESKGKEKSQIIFSDSILEKAKDKNLSRNAIDRFTGGTIDGALFTERTYFGGETKLTIRFRKDLLQSGYVEIDPEVMKYKSALAASIADLHAGFLAIGGLTAVGRGIFEVTEINGETFSGNAEELYNRTLSILCANCVLDMEDGNGS